MKLLLPLWLIIFFVRKRYVLKTLKSTQNFRLSDLQTFSCLGYSTDKAESIFWCCPSMSFSFVAEVVLNLAFFFASKNE